MMRDEKCTVGDYVEIDPQQTHQQDQKIHDWRNSAEVRPLRVRSLSDIWSAFQGNLSEIPTRLYMLDPITIISLGCIRTCGA